MNDRAKAIRILEGSYKSFVLRHNGELITVNELLALLEAQEPRVMTEQEMRDAEPGAVIYCEHRDEVRTYLTPLIKYNDGVFENRFLGAEPEATQLPNVRFWTSRPTDEQREATPWEP